jgi:hypothetical protein
MDDPLHEAHVFPCTYRKRLTQSVVSLVGYSEGVKHNKTKPLYP